MNAKTFYEVLEISEHSNLDDIKRSYRKLALKYHPDRNLDDVRNCTELFKRIAEAYSVLSDDSARREYDRNLKFQARSVQESQSPKFEGYTKQYKTNSSVDDNQCTKNNTKAPFSEEEEVLFSCSFPLRKAHSIFNDFFEDFEQFQGGQYRNISLSSRSRDRFNSMSFESEKPYQYILNDTPRKVKKHALYRNVDLRDKYKSSTFDSWKPHGEEEDASLKFSSQFIYFFGDDQQKNKNLKAVHKRRQMI